MAGRGRSAGSDEVRPDGDWHTLAADLVRVMAEGATTQVGIKIIVGETGSAKLTVEKLWFADELPPEATISTVNGGEAKSVVLDWTHYGVPQPAPGWATSAATDFSATADGEVMEFAVRGAGKQMRWPLKLPEPVDLTACPYVALRYRASGDLGTSTYAVWLGDDATGAGQHSSHPLLARDLIVDGQWHTLTAQLNDSFTATQLAVGVDCAGGEATMALSPITFSSAPPRWPIRQLLAYEARDGMPRGYALLPAALGGAPSPFYLQRLSLTDWFDSGEITVSGVPFTVPLSLNELNQTATASLETLTLALPETAAEVYLLVSAAVPATEPWGIDHAHPRVVDRLSVPEKMVCEIRYTQGPADFVLPIDLSSGQWGLKRGVSVCVVHPDPDRTPTMLLLHDRMRTGAFAIVGATARSERPRVPEPTWDGLTCRPPPRGALARLSGSPRVVPGCPLVTSGKLSAQFALQPTFAWWALQAGSEVDAVACARGPVFEVEVNGRVLPTGEWSASETEPIDAGWRFTTEHAGSHLRATVDCLPGAANGLRMRLTLRNTGPEPTNATVRFPVVRGLRMGAPADTWYLFGRRGGIINHTPVSFREPLGEPHPLQMDGFFNPKLGLALACLTHDTVGQHHFINMGMTDAGGEWSPEYPRRDIRPGDSFATTEAELVLCEGDWRAIFAAYRQWLATWFRPPATKPWWERTFAFLGCNAHYHASPDPRLRGAIQPRIDRALDYLGVCDYVHLFGWSSSPTYGDWGDYGHYDETIGGIDYFRGNIAAARASGVRVGLYQDGYLSSGKGESVGGHAEEWAMRRADGTPNYVPQYDAYNQCPYNGQWRQYLAATYKRIADDTGAAGLYIDEYGATDGRWVCYASDHGHNSYEVPYAGEVATMRAIREAVGAEIALYTEYPSAEVSRQIVDGSFTYQALWSADEEPLAPHFIDLPRFAFPHYKQFHIIYYVAPREGNWWLLKFPFFNGESYDIGEPNLPSYDDAALAFQQRAIRVLTSHREAFSSHDVEPLVPTLVPGVFANRFTAADETIWTLYNANGRGVREAAVAVQHVPGADYEDLWNETRIEPVLGGETARLAVELAPKGVGCVAQRKGQGR
jgi:hypothetical protein